MWSEPDPVITWKKHPECSYRHCLTPSAPVISDITLTTHDEATKAAKKRREERRREKAAAKVVEQSHDPERDHEDRK